MPIPNDPRLTTRAITPRPGSMREDDRSVEFVISTELPARVFDWERFDFVDEILLQNGMELPPNRQVPFQDSHSTKSVEDVLGSMRELRADGGISVGRAYFSRKQKAFDAWQDVRDGHITDVSVGYEVTKSTWINAGERKLVQGREYEGPLRVSEGWRLREVSLVAIGADEYAKVRSAHMPESSPTPGPAAEATILQEEIPVEKENTTPTPPAAPAEKVDVEAIATRAAQAERDRITGIRAACVFPGCEEIAEAAISNGDSVDRVRQNVLAYLKTQQQSLAKPTVEAGPTDAEKFRSAASDALTIRAIGKTPSKVIAAGADQLSRISMFSLAQECLRRAGRSTFGLSREEIYRQALGRRSSSSVPSLNTGDFSYILADVANKSMMVGYTNAPTTYQLWCSIGDLPDFKAARRVQISDAPALLETAEGAEVQQGVMTDTGESVQLVTYARKLCITRQALINDDMGAFNTIFRAFGARAADLINSLPYAVLAANANLADGGALFNTTAVTTAGGHANLAETPADVTSTAVNVGRTAMFSQTAPQGIKLNIKPRFILVGAAKQSAAEILTGSMALPDATYNSGVLNPYNTMIAIPDANIAGNQWYLAADPSMVATVEVAFLDGNRAPTLTEEETSPILGVDFTGLIDATAKALDFRGLFSNTGA